MVKHCQEWFSGRWGYQLMGHDVWVYKPASNNMYLPTWDGTMGVLRGKPWEFTNSVRSTSDFGKCVVQ